MTGDGMSQELVVKNNFISGTGLPWLFTQVRYPCMVTSGSLYIIIAKDATFMLHSNSSINESRNIIARPDLGSSGHPIYAHLQ